MGAAAPRAGAQGRPFRLDHGRFTVVAYPADAHLARSLLQDAVAEDSFPGLPRPRERVLLAIAPDARRFREWVGPGAPEWGAAVAIPVDHRIVMQGSSAGSGAGNPVHVLRHELAHLALHEYLGDLPPRWFDEGYASFSAGEWRREDVLSVNLALFVRGVPPLDSLNALFHGNAAQADAAYALAYRAVAELNGLDPDRGLTLFLRYWRATGSMDQAIRQAYGMTFDAFAARWHGRMERRYGLLAAAANLTLLFAVLGLIIVPLYVIRVKRDRRRMAELRAAEAAAERAARVSALAALLAGAAAPGPPGEASPEPSPGSQSGPSSGPGEGMPGGGASCT